MEHTIFSEPSTNSRGGILLSSPIVSKKLGSFSSASTELHQVKYCGFLILWNNRGSRYECKAVSKQGIQGNLGMTRNLEHVRGSQVSDQGRV